MSRWKLVRLKFGRGVAHFGELGIGLEETSERVRSDTLFSAWVSAYARLFSGTEVESLINRCKQPTPLFRLSSAFIYQQVNGELIEYLPRPLKFPQNYPIGDDLEFTKTFQKLKYLPLSIWQRWYQGEGFTPDDRDELIAATKGKATGSLTDAGTFAYSQAFKTQKLPKVAIDRTTRATNFYHTGVVSYRWELVDGEIESRSGLYFLVEFPTKDTAFDQTFFAVLDFLGGEGLGGERSSGAGQFKVDYDDQKSDQKSMEENFNLTDEWKRAIEFPEGESHGLESHSLVSCLMSLFWTDDHDHLKALLPGMALLPEGAASQASYELQARGGWIASPSSNGRQMRRQAVQMFTEGSVFPAEPSGKLADVTPNGFEQSSRGHKVYRSGIALSLPIKVKE
ncbi:MAG: type III-A CRISPR-associated RAMP protein Csm4 [Cyanobacteria bacterium CRU_2_1]|nr:type III-A CRISPR-associated RAMP protein Csm4 [Cyanobacteria bacterium CRU_2_1]